ncbi:MAG: GDSL-type esterase/lipase family protein [Nitrospira sp.]|jgi:lysophospholipase L1-like esterase|nr:GDSL-type esterase/lipase family protein [Nitrospira sp.]
MNEQQTRGPVSFWRGLTYSLVIMAVLLGGAEVILRVWANYFRVAYLTYDSVRERPALVPNARIQNSSEHVAINSKGFVGPEFEKQKPAGTIRIIALGDSCTFAGGWYETTYSGLLDRFLKDRYPDKRIEVINAGISGFNSEFALARLRDELLEYQPDMVTLYIGWNDLMKTNPVSSAATRQYKYSGIWKALNESYLVKAYSKVLFYYLRPLLMKPKLDGDPEGAAAFDQFMPVVYQSNVDAIAAILESQSIHALFVTRPTAVRLGMTQDDIEREHIFFPYFAGAYSLERFLSLHRSYNRAIEDVARRHQIPLVDLDALFNLRKKDGLFQDTMHLSDEGNRVVAEALVEPIGRALKLTQDNPS